MRWRDTRELQKGGSALGQAGLHVGRCDAVILPFLAGTPWLSAPLSGRIFETRPIRAWNCSERAGVDAVLALIFFH